MPEKHDSATNAVLGRRKNRSDDAGVIEKTYQNERHNVKNILLIESSPRGSDSYSHQAARSIVNELRTRNPGSRTVVRDLGQNPPPHAGRAFIGALQAQPEELTPDQVKALAYSDLLINEVLEADVIVLAVPVHNFTIPSTLKAWIDHIVRAGRTFSYTSNGPKGLVTGKRAILVLAT